MAKTVDPVISAVLRTDRLSEETRTGYSKRLALIAAAAGNNPLIPVLAQHPQKVLGWILKNYQEIGTQRTMIVAILGAYKILNLKIKEKGSYEMYLKEYEKLDGVLRDRAQLQLVRPGTRRQLSSKVQAPLPSVISAAICLLSHYLSAWQQSVSCNL